MELTGLEALVTIIVQLGFIWIAFYALQGMHFEQMFRRPPKTLPLLTVILATALGYLCASFVITILKSIHNLIYLAR